MATATFRHKHVRIDQTKLDQVRRFLDARTETEALDRALDLILIEQRILAALRSVRGKGKLEKAFR